MLSFRDLAQLQELVDILDPFLEATALTEGDKVVTITVALPSVLALISHVQEIRRRLKFCGSVAFSLLASLNNRFDGMLQRVMVPKAQRVSDIGSLPFGADIYLISTFFDPVIPDSSCTGSMLI